MNTTSSGSEEPVCPHGYPIHLESECPDCNSGTETKKTGDLGVEKYSPEADRQEIIFKASKIRLWATEQGWKEGVDFWIIEDLSAAAPAGEMLSRHETKQFAVGVQEARYQDFRNYVLGRYSNERATENPSGKVQLDYSWGGRFAVGWDGVPFDTVPVENMSTGARTHHQEFKKFFKKKTGLDFPTAAQLNLVLREISDKGLDNYRQQKERIQQLRNEGRLSMLPDHGDGLLSGLDHAVNILTKAQSGDATQELPEQILQMPEEMRWYADLTYNTEDIKDLSRLGEITGIPMPDDIRMDKIFERFGLNRNKMEDLCREFAEHLEQRDS